MRSLKRALEESEERMLVYSRRRGGSNEKPMSCRSSWKPYKETALNQRKLFDIYFFNLIFLFPLVAPGVRLLVLDWVVL